MTDGGMSHEAPDTEEPAAEPRRRGAAPLSQATRRRLLGKLLTAAEVGDAAAFGVLVELSLAAERDEQIATALRELRAGKGEA